MSRASTSARQFNKKLSAKEGQSNKKFAAKEDGIKCMLLAKSEKQATARPQAPRDTVPPDFFDGPCFCKMLVPNYVAGSIIGRKGLKIEKMGKISDCRLQISASNRFFPGTKDRITVMSGTLEQIEDAVTMIIRTMQEFWFRPTNGRYTIKLAVPRSTVSRLIGETGSTMQSLGCKTGARVKVSKRLEEMLERIVIISGQADGLLEATLDVVREIQVDPRLKEHLALTYDVELPLGAWERLPPPDPDVELINPAHAFEYTKSELIEYLHKAAPHEILIKNCLLGGIRRIKKSKTMDDLVEAVVDTWRARAGNPYDEAVAEVKEMPARREQGIALQQPAAVLPVGAIRRDESGQVYAVPTNETENPTPASASDEPEPEQRTLSAMYLPKEKSSDSEDDQNHYGGPQSTESDHSTEESNASSKKTSGWRSSNEADSSSGSTAASSNVPDASTESTAASDQVSDSFPENWFKEVKSLLYDQIRTLRQDALVEPEVEVHPVESTASSAETQPRGLQESNAKPIQTYKDFIFRHDSKTICLQSKASDDHPTTNDDFAMPQGANADVVACSPGPWHIAADALDRISRCAWDALQPTEAPPDVWHSSAQTKAASHSGGEWHAPAACGTAMPAETHGHADVRPADNWQSSNSWGRTMPAEGCTQVVHSGDDWHASAAWERALTAEGRTLQGQHSADDSTSAMPWESALPSRPMPSRAGPSGSGPQRTPPSMVLPPWNDSNDVRAVVGHAPSGIFGSGAPSRAGFYSAGDGHAAARVPGRAMKSGAAPSRSESSAEFRFDLDIGAVTFDELCVAYRDRGFSDEHLRAHWSTLPTEAHMHQIVTAMSMRRHGSVVAKSAVPDSVRSMVALLAARHSAVPEPAVPDRRFVNEQLASVHPPARDPMKEVAMTGQSGSSAGLHPTLLGRTGSSWYVDTERAAEATQKKLERSGKALNNEECAGGAVLQSPAEILRLATPAVRDAILRRNFELRIRSAQAEAAVVATALTETSS